MSPGGQFGVTPKGEIGTGHWKEWVEDGALGITIGWGNTLLRRAGRCPFQTFNEAMSKTAQGTLRGARAKALAANADGADNPMGVPESIYRANAEDADRALQD